MPRRSSYGALPSPGSSPRVLPPGRPTIHGYFDRKRTERKRVVVAALIRLDPRRCGVLYAMLVDKARYHTLRNRCLGRTLATPPVATCARIGGRLQLRR